MYNIILLAILLVVHVGALGSLSTKELLDDITHKGRYAAVTYQRFEEWNSTQACPECQHEDIRNTDVNTTWSTALPAFSRGYIGIDHRQRHAVVAFRGTTHIMDVLTDAQLAQTHWPPDVAGSRVHLGFLAAYMSARDVVQTALDALETGNLDHVWFVGHSLGAAQATLAFVDYMDRRGRNNNTCGAMHPQLVTFGSPRVGNREFARHVDALLDAENDGLRVVHEADVVPHLPRPLLLPFQDYAHSAREVWAMDSDDVPASVLLLCRKRGGEEEEEGEDPECSASVSPLSWNIVDHMVYPGIRIGVPKFLVQ
ncbi:hypothetical protein EV175_005073 [Coemansia sp. RSA 1933]|nr:hypothetical protein EV175_005073 [Coemansia sp. RSA 1933]